MSSPYGRPWRRARAQYLASHPCCTLCLQRGIVEPATVVDHVIPHRGDPVLFNDRGNWQPLCQTCHDAVKQAQEKSGRLRGSDVTGLPLDAAHPWLREKRGDA